MKKLIEDMNYMLIYSLPEHLKIEQQPADLSQRAGPRRKVINGYNNLK